MNANGRRMYGIFFYKQFFDNENRDVYERISFQRRKYFQPISALSTSPFALNSFIQQSMERQKTKVRFTSLDVAAMVSNLQFLIGMRATNIYDLNPSTYLFKLAKSEEKSYLLIENGVRFHTVQDKEDKKTIPSGFTMKFRKFLRSKRLESIRQVGVERVVVLTFGGGAYTNHLILQLYSQGNIILTDDKYRILQCIRSHEFNEKVKTAVGEIYPFEYAANIYLQNIDVSQGKVQQVLNEINKPQQSEQSQISTKKKKKQNTKKHGSKLRDIVFKLVPCLFPLVIQHILIAGSMNPDDNVTLEDLPKCVEACRRGFKFLKQFLKLEHKGYLFVKPKKQNEEPEYFEYSPYSSIKYKDKFQCVEKENFDKAVEKYYKHYKKSQNEEEEIFQELAWKKYDQIKKDQQSRVHKLQQEQQIYKLKASYIEKNIEDVEAIIQIVKTMEENGYSWDVIGRMISESKKNGDPLANLIHDLNILKRQVTILLGDPDEEQQYGELLPVEINIDYNAYTNATMYYESKKKNYQKQLRTKEASQQVLKIAEKDAMKKIEKKKQEQMSKSVPTRKMFWFEKFYWFISTEGFLVIAGRDSHQNQLLVKRYMKPGDLYMHSDYGGAASTVIKINEKNIPVPRTTLEEAAVFTVCRSKAWDTKIISGAWWVYHDQVSKSAPTGEFLPTGSFMIRGKRNFIQPNRMEMGLTLLYKIDQDSIKRHLNDRRIHEDAEEKKVEEDKDHGEEYAIISLETTSKVKVKMKIMQGPKGKQEDKKKEVKNENPQLKKNPSSKWENVEKENSSENSEESEDDSEENRNKKGNAKNKQSNKNQKKQEEQQQPKQKMRNKRKLKRLQKYMEEQDDEEREIIMKMIGARQMKHLKKEDDEGEEKIENKKKNKKNKNKKKGMEKFFQLEATTEQSEKLNPDKVLFLKNKQKAEESSDEEVQQLNEKEEVQKEEKDEEKEDKEEKEEDKDSEENLEGKEEELGEENNEMNEDGSGEEKMEEAESDKQEEKKQEKEKVQQEEQEVDDVTLNSQLAELFKLVGKAHPEDKYENLVPMCAPYSAMKENRFKIKLVPGGLKKGKAARNILHYFINTSDLVEEEKPFLRSLPEQQVINALLGNVKLAGAGLLKMELKEKAQKKEKRKQNDKKNKK